MTAAKKASGRTERKSKPQGGKGARKGTRSLPIAEVVRSDEQVDEIISRANEKAERWAEAWRMDAMGVPSRVIGQRLGISHTQALEYARNWLQLVDGDPARASERAEIVARLDLMAEKMLVELTRLEAAEAVKPAEGRAAVWLENSDPLLKVLAQKARLVSGGDSGKKVTVEVAAGASGGVPDAVAGVLARITVEDGDAA